jgi:Ser/Thr protein kinase RdoA (MazF antagonist)
MTSEAKMHGFNGEAVEPDWPVLTEAEIGQLVRRYPEAGKVKQILTYSPRPFSAASLVATTHRNLFVKRHHASIRDREGLLEEHRLLAYLRLHGGHVVTVLADENGETAIRAGEWTYEVHAQAEGQDLYQLAQSWTPFLSTRHAGAAGRALAELHLAAEGYDAPQRKAQTLVASFSIFAASDPWPTLENYVAARPALAEYLEKRDWRAQTEATLLPYHAALRCNLGSLSPLWTHNDFHASNLLWSSAEANAEVVSVIDFGLSDRTNAAHDLAMAIERNGVEWLTLNGDFDRVVHVKQVDALLAGYEQVRPLTKVEAQAVAAMLPLVHAEYALSETEYCLRVLKSEEKASLGWDGYFLGHAEWFRSDAGKRLSDHVYEWAGRSRRETVETTVEVAQ